VFIALLSIILKVIMALRERRALALDPSIWRQLIGVHSAEDSLEALVDLISEVPILLERTDQVVASSVGSPELLRTLLEVSERFRTWQRSYRLSSAGPMYWAAPSRLHNPSDDAFASKLFPFTLDFASLNAAIQSSFSSAVMLQVLTAALLLLERDNASYKEIIEQDKPDHSNHELLKLESQNDEKTSWSVCSIQQEADRLARFLCQTIEYSFRYEMGTLGAQTTCHPQWALRSYFRYAGLPRELEWCKNINNMHDTSLRPGLALMLFGPNSE
jgi:hypothetical protein